MRWTRGALALGALLALGAGTARAAEWSEVFAASTDTVVFFAADGTLMRAPFSLASRETLWYPEGGERLVRLRVSPDGRRVAWLTRRGDRDTTRVWVDGPEGAVQRVRCFALLADQYGRVRSEPGVPTTEDREARGARFVQPNTFMRRGASNTIEWTPDSRAVVFGYDGGIAAVPADGGVGFGVTRALALGLVSLDPAPIYLVSAIVMRPTTTRFDPGAHPNESPSDSPAILEDGRPITSDLDLLHPDVMNTRSPSEENYLLYPMAHRWRVFPAPDIGMGSQRAESPGTVWWVSGRTIRALRTSDPTSTEELRSRSDIVWIGFDEAHRALVWATGNEVGRRAEDGGPSAVVFHTAAPIRRALPARAGREVGFVAGDSLVVWDPADDAVRRFALGGENPATLFVGADGSVLVATEPSRGVPGLARADSASGSLRAIETPSVKGGMFHATPDGAWLLLYDPASRPPDTLQAFDARAGKWTPVRNPGLAGWEPLEPR